MWNRIYDWSTSYLATTLISYFLLSLKSSFYFMIWINSIIKRKRYTCFNWSTSMSFFWIWKRLYWQIRWSTFRNWKTNLFRWICIWNCITNTWRKSFEINVFHFWISNICSNITLNSRIRLNDNSYEWNIFIMFSWIFDMRRSIKKTISSNSFTSWIKKWYILQIVDIFLRIKSKIRSRMMIKSKERRLKNSIASWSILYIRSLSMRRRTKTFFVNWRNYWKTKIWMIE
jgi:hypothetical protein